MRTSRAAKRSGAKPDAFDTVREDLPEVATISRLRADEPATPLRPPLLPRGIGKRRRTSGIPRASGGVVAFSRILGDREVTVVANCSATQTFNGAVLRDPNMGAGRVTVGYSNLGTTGSSMTGFLPNAKFFDRGTLVGSGPAVLAPIDLKPGEIQVLVPA